MSEGKNNNSMSGMKVVAVLLAISLASVIAFFVIAEGAVSIITSVIGNVIQSLTDGSLGRDIYNAVFFWDYKAPDGDLYFYSIDNTQVETIRKNLEEKSIDSDLMGLTSIMIKKMLVVSSASKGIDQSVMVVELSEEELDELEEKYEIKGTEKAIWAGYDVNYITDALFYFTDDGTMGHNGKSYLGAYGRITIKNSEGGEMTHYNDTSMQEIINKYKAANSANRADIEEVLLNAYTINTDGSIKVYTIDSKEYSFNYKFYKGNYSTIISDVTKVNDETEYNVNSFIINLNQIANFQKFFIPVELLADLLTITGSPQFTDEFIDYALDKTKVDITAYSTQNEVNTYKTNEYEINSDFTLEVYDFDGETNFNAYKDIVASRRYDDATIKRVTDLADWETINNSDAGKPLADYLQLANEGNSGVKNYVRETLKTRSYVTSWTVYPSKASTWYADISYTAPQIIEEYIIDSNSEATVVDKPTYESYDNFGFIKEANKTGTKASENIIQKLGYGESQEFGTDIWDDSYKVEFDKNGENFKKLTTKALGYIAQNDGGDKNSDFGAFSGSDYLYLNYTKNNIKTYEGESVYRKIASIDTIYETRTDNDANAQGFLALLKNSEGTIEGAKNGYDSNGKVVEYDDIYGTKSKAGDLLANGAEMLFELLESSENTKGLTNEVRYLMYLYTGIDYGVTSVEQLLDVMGVAGAFNIGIIVKTDEANALKSLTKEELEKVIKENYSGQEEANLLSALPGIYKGQEQYNVNGLFSIAVARIESHGGTDWDLIDPSTYNMYSIKSGDGWRQFTDFSDAAVGFASLIAESGYYFKAGKTSIIAIAPTYCDEAWGQAVTEEVKRLCENSGIELPKSTSVGGAPEMVEYALSYVGRSGSQMSSVIGFSGEWCAAFVSHCYRQYGFIPGALDQTYYSCTALMNYAKSKGCFIGPNSIPQPGDLILYNWNSDSYSEHVGMVVDCDGTNVYTVEGNIGDGSSWSTRVVGTKTRTVGWSYIYGYVSLSKALGN